MAEMRRIVVGGMTSGVGKTTVACALIAAFRRRGFRVQPFKAGPDYIDPGHHAAAAGRPSRNLDSVLLPVPNLQALFARAAERADLSLVEGVMGLFDGRNDRGEEGSTAHITKILEAPVVVVLDVSKTSRTAGAMALGCVAFDPGLRVAGFILNRAGSETHARLCAEAVEGATHLPVFGALPRDPEVTIPERHLGLLPAAEAPERAATFDRLAALAEEHLDLDRLWQACASTPLGVSTETLFPAEPPCRARLAVARDAAFNFYYEDSLDLLRAWGAELLPFSPLSDHALPEGAQGVYIGGGFPEVFARELAENRPMLQSLREAAGRGLPIYGECGGLMYLGRSLTDFDGTCHEMTGIVQADSRMEKRRLTLGYREARALRDTPLLPAGEEIVAHEFHYSELDSPPSEHEAAYAVAPPRGHAESRPEGYARGNVLASYLHLHAGSNPQTARRFVAACAGVAP